MKTCVTADGRRFFAERIVGTDACINGIYVEYSDIPAIDAEGRSQSYFTELKSRPHSGYGRIHVRELNLDEDGNVKVSGVFTAADLKGGKISKDSRIVAATLAYMPDGVESHDRILYTSILSEPMRIVKGVYMSLTIKIKIY